MSYAKIPAGTSEHSKDYVLVQQRLKEWIWFQSFLEQNPDVEVRWEKHKTYEILNNDNGTN